MTSGVVYPVDITLPFTNYTWKAGHQIKIYVSGNSSIRWDVNLQDGGTMYQSGTGNMANISIHHNPTSPSKIMLPGNNGVLGLHEAERNQLYVYPNPMTDFVHLSSNEGLSALRIHDAAGRSYCSELNGLTLDLSHLSRGVYYLRGLQHDLPFTIKVIKD